MNNPYENQDFDPEITIKDCEKKIQENPQDTGSYFVLGNILTLEKKYSESIEIYKKLLEIEPENTDALVSLGSLLFLIGELSESEKTLNKAAKIEPDNSLVFLNLAGLFAKKHNYTR